MYECELVIEGLTRQGHAMIAHRRAVAAAATDIIIDAIKYSAIIGMTMAKRPADVFTIEDGLSVLAETPKTVERKIGSLGFSTIATHPVHGDLVLAPRNRVGRSDVLIAGNSRPGLPPESLPDDLFLEEGRDRRDAFPAIDTENRHPIDWHRPASAMGDMMPRFTDLNPYSAFDDTRNGAIAMATWNVLQAYGTVAFKDITKEVLVRARLEDSASSDDGMVIRDCLRDLALFGMCAAYKSVGGSVVYRLPS